jgi:hypothetical protein
MKVFSLADLLRAEDAFVGERVKVCREAGAEGTPAGYVINVLGLQR